MGESKRRKAAKGYFDPPEAHAIMHLQDELNRALDRVSSDTASVLAKKISDALNQDLKLTNRMERAAIIVAAAATAARYELSRVALINAPKKGEREIDLRASALIGFFYESMGKASAVAEMVDTNPQRDVEVPVTEGKA